MNLLLSYSSILICIIILSALIISTIMRLRKSENLADINLSWIWKTGICTLIIGTGVQIFNVIHIFDSINEMSDADVISSHIKDSLVLSFYFIIITISSIVAWYSMKIYRQYLFNQRFANY